MIQNENHEVYPVRSDLAARVQQELGQNVYLCYQCVKCTSGCVLSEFFDWQPNQIMRALQLGFEDVALQSKTPWLCASCQTCTTRCPQGLDIAAIMEFLTRESLARGYESPIHEVQVFNEAFMREVRLWNRAYELGLMAEINLRTGKIFNNLDLGVKMLPKNKVPLFPTPVRPPKKVKPVAGAAQSVAYYPGCSLHSTAGEFNRSAKSVCEALDIGLVEPKGWNCCGSSAAHRADPELALRLPMQNLALIEQSGFQEVTMPCAACYNRHKAALFEIRQHSDHKSEMDQALNYTYLDSVKVNTLLETVLEHAGTQQISGKVTRPLQGLRVVSYYGCLITRPAKVTEAKHPENPTEMDHILGALGAEVIDWSYKTTCCGAAHSLTRPDIVLQLSSSLISHARDAGAEVIAVACPLCHTNLDARQFQMELETPMPVLYFTQLMALAFGQTEEAALQKNLVDPRPLLKQRGLL